MSRMKRIEVVAAVIADKGRLLATQRGYGDHKGLWEFPGGKVECGESLEDALKREIFEELDMEISVDRFLLTVEWTYPTFHLKMHCFLCSRIGEVLCVKEHADARWLLPSDLDSVEWLLADILVVRKLQSLFNII